MDRVLAFGCHPDDVEYFAAGTLALLAEKGYEIHVAVLAGGEVGHPTMKPQEIRERRLVEGTKRRRCSAGSSTMPADTTWRSSSTVNIVVEPPALSERLIR